MERKRQGGHRAHGRLHLSGMHPLVGAGSHRHPRWSPGHLRGRPQGLAELVRAARGVLQDRVRKHWFEVLTDSGETTKIYFERQRRARKNTARWWLFTIETA